MDKNYEKLILLRIGEIALKGLNRKSFENQLVNNLRSKLKELGDYKIQRFDSRVWISAKNEEDKLEQKELITAISDVFGFVSSSPVRRFAKDLEVMDAEVLKLAMELYADGKAKSFRLEVKRTDKQFPLKSYDLAVRYGDLICRNFPDLATVDLHNPQLTFHLEVREKAYLYTEIIPARKGLPVGVGGKGLLMLSGGIDSPVAGYLMSSRGMKISAIYFHTHPYTSEEAKEKVVDLARILSKYNGSLDLYISDFTDTQLALGETCPEDMMTIVMRRMMILISCKLAESLSIPALISGESLGQVASQTVEAIACTDAAADRPIFRPLIGTDKEEIIIKARDIGTYETSILPYEDCCTVFVAKHPKTHPRMKDVYFAEKNLDMEALAEEALCKITKLSLP